MKVSTLIEELSKLDPDAEVVIGDPDATYYGQKPLEPFIEQVSGYRYGHFLKKEVATYRHTAEGKKVILWMEIPEKDAEISTTPPFIWDEDLQNSILHKKTIEDEMRRHQALKFRTSQWELRRGFDSIIYSWFPISIYENLENPYMDLTGYVGD